MQVRNYNYIEIEKKWQKQWFENRLFEVKKSHYKKFFICFAYPNISEYLHIEHMRGFTYYDITARIKYMNAYDVLYPPGFHTSNISSIGFAKKVERKDPKTINDFKEYGVSDKQIKKIVKSYRSCKLFKRSIC